MTSLVASRSPDLLEQARAGDSSSARTGLAVRVRRWFLVASPLLAGLFAVIGAAADPAAGISGRAMWELYASNPDPLQLKSFGFHWSYAFWIAPALLLAAYVRQRGAWLATIAAAVAFVGLTTLPGLLIVDFYDSAIGQVAGVGVTADVNAHMESTMWGPKAIALPGILGFALGLPLAALGLWRAGLVRWWAPLAVVGAFGVLIASGVTVWGATFAAGLLALFAVAVERATR